MKARILLLAAVGMATAAPLLAAGAGHTPQARVRYIEDSVPAAVAFYTRDLGFHLDAQSGPNFAMLSKGPLQLVLSPPEGPGGASQPMSNGEHARPGGWNRMILPSNNLAADVARLRKAGVHFRNAITRGPGGAEVLLDDPSRNPVELFQAGA